MAASPAYGEDKGGSSSLGEPEYGHDPASGGIFSSDYKRWGQRGGGRGDTGRGGGTAGLGGCSPPGPWYPTGRGDGDGDGDRDEDGEGAGTAMRMGMGMGTGDAVTPPLQVVKAGEGFGEKPRGFGAAGTLSWGTPR